MTNKIMSFANFNITFGETEEPMLTHFLDIIYPAFSGGYIRGKEGELPIFSFGDIKVRKINDENVLVGNYIKDTQYNVRTTVENGELKSTPTDVPTAPYSRFIIFLKNHRMVLLRNETMSPDIRSFQATVREILKKFIREQNNLIKEKENKLPFAIVNIVDIPLKESIETVLKNINKIDWVKMRFFPPNNDIIPLPIAQSIREEMKAIGSKTANAKFNSPNSKAGVHKMIVDTAGFAHTTMQVTDEDGESKKIKEDSFSSNKEIPFGRDILENDDEYIISLAKKDNVINETSKDNQKLYEKFHILIDRIIDKNSL